MYVFSSGPVIEVHACLTNMRMFPTIPGPVRERKSSILLIRILHSDFIDRTRINLLRNTSEDDVFRSVDFLSLLQWKEQFVKYVNVHSFSPGRFSISFFALFLLLFLPSLTWRGCWLQFGHKFLANTSTCLSKGSFFVSLVSSIYMTTFFLDRS